MMPRVGGFLSPGFRQLLPSSLVNKRRDTHDSQSP
jgi:hypothetical protein